MQQYLLSIHTAPALFVEREYSRCDALPRQALVVVMEGLVAAQRDVQDHFTRPYVNRQAYVDVSYIIYLSNIGTR